MRTSQPHFAIAPTSEAACTTSSQAPSGTQPTHSRHLRHPQTGRTAIIRQRLHRTQCLEAGKVRKARALGSRIPHSKARAPQIMTTHSRAGLALRGQTCRKSRQQRVRIGTRRTTPRHASPQSTTPGSRPATRVAAHTANLGLQKARWHSIRIGTHRRHRKAARHLQASRGGKTSP